MIFTINIIFYFINSKLLSVRVHRRECPRGQNTYPPQVDKRGHLANHLPTPFCPRGFWMTPNVRDFVINEFDCERGSKLWLSWAWNCEAQCAPGFFNPNQKVHGLFHFYNAVVYKTVENQLKKPSVIGLPKFTIVIWLKNAINMQILV